MVYVCRVYAHICIQVAEDVGCPALLLPNPLRQGLLLNLVLSWWPVSPSNLSDSTPNPGVTGSCETMPCFFVFVFHFVCC